MIWVFIVFTLLLIPTMNGYRSGIAYDGDERAGHATGMISNLGYSTVECRNIPVSLGKIAITCPYGTVGKIFDYGINNPDTGSPIDACVNNEFNSKCRPDSQRIGDLLNATIGKDKASISFSMGDFYRGNTLKVCSDPTNLFFVQYSCI